MVARELEELQKALFDFSKRNRFIHVRVEDLFLFDNDQSKLARLYAKSRFYTSEYGLETSLQVAVFIKWSPPSIAGQTDKVYYTSPLFYKPCRIRRIRRIETHYAIEIDEDDYMVNPVIRHYFEQFYDLKLPLSYMSVEEGIAALLSYFNDASSQRSVNFKEVTWFDESTDWQLIVRQAVGLFNYKKSALSADFDLIKRKPNSALSALLGDQKISYTAEPINEFHPITVLDESQRNTIISALNGNLVMQGPPGTGKSHTIVALIAAFLREGKKILFVSEKKSALDVVSKRLSQIGLGNYVAYFNTGKHQKKHFYGHLKKSWETINQSGFSGPAYTDFIGEDLQSLLQIYPERLRGFREDLGCSLNDLIHDLFSAGWSPGELQLKGQLPDFKTWKHNLPFLINFEKDLCPVFEVKNLGQLVIGQFNSAVFSEQQVIVMLEKRLNEIQLNLTAIAEIQETYNLKGGIDDFTRLAITGSILNTIDKVQIDLINADSKKYKSFDTVAKKYDLLKAKVERAIKANEKWTSKPSMSEITELTDLIKQSTQNQQGSFLRRLRRNPAKLKTVFKDFHTGISDHTKLKLLESLKLEFRLVSEFNTLKLKLKHDYKIEDPAREIDLIFKLRSKLNAVSQNDYLTILEHPESTQLINALSKIHPEIVRFNSQCRYLFDTSINYSLLDFTHFISQLKAYLPIINHWLSELKQYFALPIQLRQFIAENIKSIAHLDAALTYAKLLEETRFEIHFNRLSGKYLTEVCQHMKMYNSAKHRANLDEINQRIKNQLRENESLLAKAGFKLKAEEKKRKLGFKEAKRTILHEINKQQRHLPIKSLVDITGEFLMAVQPVWMMNPLTVSEFLPCQADFFDLVIFDESSQIPLEDAIPSVYRAKQFVVVGDSKQMPPSRFFTNGEESKTVLDQAELSVESLMLRWHYRSKHPDLIRFSNLEFYNGNLLCLPPVNNISPFEYHYVKGVYEDGVNRIEALALANYAQNFLDSSTKKMLILAFSRSQEMAIRNELKKLRIESHPLLTIRNLENAQGIEAEIVLMSFGYGKDTEGNFRLNFGPINQQNGANRLNVFFTRAIEKMVVFTSVKSSEFSFSDNRGVQLLHDFLAYVEHYKQAKSEVSLNSAQEWVKSLLNENKLNIHFYPVGEGLGISAFVDAERKKILLLDPGLEQGQSIEIQALYQTLTESFNEVRFLLTYDIWVNPDRSKRDLLAFFME